MNAIKTKKAFTLIELLVVIAIIALLLAIMMPALKKAKGLAQMTAGMTNQKNLMIAWRTYNSDNNGEMVGGNTESRNLNGKPVSANSPDWVKAPLIKTASGLIHSFGSEFVETPLENEINGIREGLLFPYIEDEDVYRCPADNRLKLKGLAQPASFRSYSIVATMNGEEYSFVKPYRVTKEAQISNASSKFVFMDDFDKRSFNMGSWIFNPETNLFYDAVAVWHPKKCNYSYADGHVEGRKWKDLRTHKYARYVVYGDADDEITNKDACDNNDDVRFLSAGFRAK